MSYKYIKPQTIQEVVSTMQQYPDYHLLAGGTDLLVKMKLGRIESGTFVDISDLNELKQITVHNNTITIGAAVTHSQISSSADIIELAPALAAASASVGSPQIRNRGTVGGNCGNASPAGDTIPALLAYHAVVNVNGPQGVRTIPLNEFFMGPGRTVLKSGEFILSFSFSMQQPGQGSAFEKLGKRKALAISIINIASFISVDADKIITQARIAMGSVAPTPIRITEIESILVGKKFTDKIIIEAAQVAADNIKPIDDVRSEAEYRKKMASILTQRTLENIRTQKFINII
ncbi:Carbon-monoxide dehydrogenase (acceptor) [Clostridium sp. DL-VIII]|uniref:FAD binding domain-containing protein n=1 Tax=Clostridium sp. DL-VIII TaxID=641107 RepID=UPI00023AF358|nr:xanthine dehydrogenase family protein subunit M [Clostridium sp. DL-VIII]EHI97730.1 Carbon-monoxide dehydrogenase (acceptor) [Clostridium sp. DL-VIII]